MTRTQKWLVAALIAYNSLVLVCNGYLRFVDPTYQAELPKPNPNSEAMLFAAINLCLIIVLTFSIWRRPANFS
jgi:uncharacterized membrane protein YidH (DUF202 family)